MGRAFASGDADRIRDYFRACFAAGTPILGEFGAKNVEDYRPGDRVWARNEHDLFGPVELKKVEEVFRSYAAIWHLHVGGEVIRTTAEHPFYVQGRGWVSAQDLAVGDLLLGHDGQTRPVEDILNTGQAEEVYNFRVGDYHTYFVGGDDWGFSVWAHNICIKPVERPNMPSQEVNGIRVYGQAQRTVGGNGNEVVDGLGRTHAQRIEAQIEQVTARLKAQGVNPDDVYIVTNRSWRTALNGLGGTFSNGANSRLVPDFIVVRRLETGGYQVIGGEVASAGQTDAVLRQRIFTGFSSTNNNPNFQLEEPIIDEWISP